MTVISDNSKGRSRPLGTLGGSWRLLIIPVLLIMILPIGVNATMFRNDSRHSGVYNDGGTRPTNALNWSLQPNTNAFEDASYWASPTVVNGVLYIGDNGQYMRAINALRVLTSGTTPIPMAILTQPQRCRTIASFSGATTVMCIPSA